MAHIFLPQHDVPKVAAQPRVQRTRLDLKPVVVAKSATTSRQPPREVGQGSKRVAPDDPLAEFYDQAREEQHAEVIVIGLGVRVKY